MVKRSDEFENGCMPMHCSALVVNFRLRRSSLFIKISRFVSNPEDVLR